MTESIPRGPRPADETTQQLHRVTPPMPRPLDPTTPPTEVLSIHDLLDGADETAPVAAPPPPRPAAVEPAPPPPRPRPRQPRQPRQQSELAQRLRSDAAAAWASGRRETRDWLGRGDNALIVATMAVALLLIIVVAAVH